MRKFACLLSVCSLAVAVGCGSGGGTNNNSTPTTPSPPTTPTNRAPSITSMSISPAFGVMGQTTFEINASASDPDGDAISYAWDVAGNPFTGTNGSIIFASGGNGVARVTVTDSKGSTASDTRSFVVGSMSGTWTVTAGPLVGSSFSLTQSQTGVVTGSFFLPGIGNGNTDPAQPGRITGSAALTMRVKVAPFTDFNMSGTMDSTGRIVSGSLQGSGFSGQPFTMAKQ
jgi:PKD domain